MPMWLKVIILTSIRFQWQGWVRKDNCFYQTYLISSLFIHNVTDKPASRILSFERVQLAVYKGKFPDSFSPPESGLPPPL